jgi:hypothetical protein
MTPFARAAGNAAANPYLISAARVRLLQYPWSDVP